MSPLSQKDYFYDANWTPAIEAIFIRELLKQKDSGEWIADRPSNDEAVRAAANVVNEMFTLSYDTEFYQTHVSALKDRYETQGWLMVQPYDVRFDAINNKFSPVYASAWDNLTMAEDDPQWQELHNLFFYDTALDYEEPELFCKCRDSSSDDDSW